MMNINKKSAFSLAESLISMMLLVLTIVLTMTSITKKKHHPVSKTSISGMYACWDDGERKQMQFDGNRQVTGEAGEPEKLDDNEDCSFEMDRRASEYYIIAVGARKQKTIDGVLSTVDGQIVQKPYKVPEVGSDENKMVLKIKLGKASDYKKNVGNTTVEDGTGTEILKAMGNATRNKSGVIPANIKTCKFIENNPCGTADGMPDKAYCEALSSDINTQNDVSVANIICTNNKDKNCSIILNTLTKKEDNIYVGDCVSNDVDSTRKTVAIKIKENDSSFKAVDNSNTAESKFANLLRSIPLYRQNGLTDTLLKYYLGDGTDRNGVVLIIW